MVRRGELWSRWRTRRRPPACGRHIGDARQPHVLGDLVRIRVRVRVRVRVRGRVSRDRGG